jgi:predicted RNase H-like HicB family nuclease
MSLLFDNQHIIPKLLSGSKMYECYIWILPEPDCNGYSVTLPFLPGVCSQGNTEEEAIENITEAFQATAACYLETDGKIPWLNKEDIEEVPAGVKEKWIAVNV